MNAKPRNDTRTGTATIATMASSCSRFERDKCIIVFAASSYASRQRWWRRWWWSQLLLEPNGRQMFLSFFLSFSMCSLIFGELFSTFSIMCTIMPQPQHKPKQKCIRSLLLLLACLLACSYNLYSCYSVWCSSVPLSYLSCIFSWWLLALTRWGTFVPYTTRKNVCTEIHVWSGEFRAKENIRTQN